MNNLTLCLILFEENLIATEVIDKENFDIL